MADGADLLRVGPRLSIPRAELSWRFTGSGGPGGQHANTANTRVELTWDIEGSRALTDHQRDLLRSRFGPVVRVVASDQRSQSQNRRLAEQRLVERLATALRPRVRRVATRPTKGSVERRLQEKRRRSDTKRHRRPGPDD